MKKKHKEEAKADDYLEEEKEAPVRLVTYVNNILRSIFSHVVHQQSATLQFYWIVCAQILHFQQLQGTHL